MIVEVPNQGEVEFPDEMPPEQVQAVLKQRFPGPTKPPPSIEIRDPKGGPALDYGQPTLGHPVPTPPTYRQPQDAFQGLYNTVTKGASAMVTPEAAALGVASKIPGVSYLVRGGLAGMGAKIVGQELGTLAGTPRPTVGQKVEGVGNALQGGLMMLPAFLGNKPDVAPDEAQFVNEPVRPLPQPNPVFPSRQVIPEQSLLQGGRPVKGLLEEGAAYEENNPDQMMERAEAALNARPQSVPPVQNLDKPPGGGISTRTPEEQAQSKQASQQMAAEFQRRLQPQVSNEQTEILPTSVPGEPGTEQGPVQTRDQAIQGGLQRLQEAAKGINNYVQAEFQRVRQAGQQGERNTQAIRSNQGQLQEEAPGNVGGGGEGNGSGNLQLNAPGPQEPSGPQLGQEGQAAQGEAANGDTARQGEDTGLGQKSYGGLFFLDPDFWTKSFGKNSAVHADAVQLYNTMRNKLGEKSAAWSMIDSPEFRAFMGPGQRRTMGDVKQWVEQNGPKVEVRKYGRNLEYTPEKQAYYDRLSQTQHALETVGFNPGEDHLMAWLQEHPEHTQKAHEYTEAQKAVDQMEDAGQDSQNTHWSSIAPKSGMPGYVEIAVVKPQKLPTLNGPEGEVSAPQQFPSSHNFPPNTLGFVRGYMEGKTFHIIEVQSDWAQHYREQLEKQKKNNPGLSDVDLHNLVKNQVNHDPLLPHYERLALKAAIEHAREQGATHIAVQDAESAMMMEGHDRTVSFGEGDAGRPLQEKGMRLHYDQTLPKIASELTGEKGTKVSFGEHKMAVTEDYGNMGRFQVYDPQDAFVNSYPTRELADAAVKRYGEGFRVETHGQPRKDLIFKNEAGQPKTDVSARLYPISKAKENFTLTGSDKPQVSPVQSQQGGIGTGIQAAIQKNKEAGALYLPVQEALDAFKEMKTRFLNSLGTRENKADVVKAKDAADNAAIIVGQRAARSQEALAKVLFGDQSTKALEATTAAIETGGDRTKLPGFLAIARAKGDTRGAMAASFAEANWDKLQSLVTNAKRLHDRVLSDAKAEGVDVTERESYIRHLYDMSKVPGKMHDLFFGSGSSMGTGFKKERTFETLYDAIEVGYGKAIKSWNSADLLESRLKSGYQEINDLQWAKGFATVPDPSTGKPILSLTEKPGYRRWDPLGKAFYIHPGYENIFKSAQGMSALRQAEVMGLPVGQALMKGIGAIKHSLLVYDTYHLMRISLKAASLGVKPLLPGQKTNRGLALLEYSPHDLANAVTAGDITQPMADWANAKRPVANMLIRQGLNVGRIQEALDSDLIRKWNIGYTGSANKWIFEKLTRSAILEGAVTEFERLQGTIPDEALAAKVAKDINFMFGNIGRQGLIRGKTWQDVARVIFLAPQWFESMAQTEARSIGQATKAASGQGTDTLAKSTGTLLLGMFIGTQILNLIFKKHTTDKNPEGHKMDAFIPGGKNGFYLSPFSLPMELTHDAIRYTRQGKTPLETAGQIVANKEAPLFRAEETLRTRRDYAGRELTDKEAVKTAAGNVLPVPLPLQAGLNPNASFQRQAMASAGFKAEPGESATQSVQTKARAFMKGEGIKLTQFDPSEYIPLRRAIEDGKMDEAKKEYTKLVAKKGEKGEKTVNQYFVEWPHAIHTQSKEMEDRFFGTLSPAEKKIYQQVREERQAISDKFFEEVSETGRPMVRPKRKGPAFSFEE